MLLECNRETFRRSLPCPIYTNFSYTDHNHREKANTSMTGTYMSNVKLKLFDSSKRSSNKVLSNYWFNLTK
ncbi:hypothetical protein EUGRSUZ_G00709 [Eucalyptus grandis]|uniref:Uncharacterized protein n=2 Tax=Eucalyptus grandis TaxID=71139 RepID=A0ACC3K1U2_EUCGR|nr:hypothetical protein EUGRSUZ_G00709 [Eucalyptus grandis]